MARRCLVIMLVVLALGACKTDTPYTSTADRTAPEDVEEGGPDVSDPADGPIDASPPTEDEPEPEEADTDTEEPTPQVALNEIACRGDEWIELLNLAREPLSLEGWILTDRPDEPGRGFVFGSGAVLEPGALTTTPLDAEGVLGFGVGCDNEEITLLTPERRVADAVTLGDPRRGVTWGRLPDGEGPWGETRPTPGAPNQALGEASLTLNEVSCRGDEFIEIINLGEDAVELAGWTLVDGDQAPQPFELSGVLDPGDVAAFEQQTRRDDGFTFAIACGDERVSLVNPEGEVVAQVTAPARPPAYTWGRLPDGAGEWTDTEPTPGAPNRAPEPTGGSLFSPLEVVTVNLTIAPEDLERLDEEPREYVPATLQLTDAQGEAEPVAVQARLKGRAGSFRPLDQKSAFKIKFNLEPGQRYRGLKRLTLNNMVQDRSMLHEWLAYTFFRGLGLPAPRVGYAYVRLNGEDYGLYSNIEALDEELLDRHFLTTQHLYEGAYGQDLFDNQVGRLEIDEGDAGDRGDLETLVALLDDPPAEGFYAATQALIDWPQVLMFMATEVYIGHWDGYAPFRNNYYIHTDDQGRLSMLPWGTDQTFRDLLSINLEERDRKGRLFLACQRDLDCITAYNQTTIELVAFAEALDAEARVREIEAAIAPWAERDPRKAYDMRAVADEVNQVLAFLQQRRADYAAYTECLLGPNPDPDNDGFICDTDCDNEDPDVYPGAPEICQDQIDQDCNGRVDDGPDCPECHERFQGPHRFLVCTTRRTRPEADARCQEQGATPVTLSTPAEAVWLAQVAMSIWPQRYWLGLDDLEEEGVFRWRDGAELNYQSLWADGEPNDYDDREDCVQMTESGRWNDIPCVDTRHAVLCEDVCEPGLDADNDGALRCGGDCDDGDPGIHPGAREICGDGIDQDCSGVPDDGGCVNCEEISRDGDTYLFCDTRLPWEEARAECQARGADLLILQDAELAAWINTQAQQRRSGPYWIGLYDPDQDNVFEWVDGSDLDFTNWNEDEPNNLDEACGHVYANDARWNDLPCDAELTFVCQETP